MFGKFSMFLEVLFQGFRCSRYVDISRVGVLNKKGFK